MARNHKLRQMVITDPADQQAPAATDQTPMVLKLREAGAVVEQFFVHSTDPRHHSVAEYVALGMAGCMLDKRPDEMLRAFLTIIRRNEEITQLREHEARYKATLSATAQQPGAGLPSSPQRVKSAPNQ